MAASLRSLAVFKQFEGDRIVFEFKLLKPQSYAGYMAAVEIKDRHLPSHGKIGDCEQSTMFPEANIGGLGETKLTVSLVASH